MTREEAIDLLDNLIGMIEDNHKSDYDTAFRIAIKALEQEPCNTDTCKVVKAYMNEWDKPITAEPKTGYWIEHEIEDTLRWLECSNCHYETYNVKHNYCPNCGARMIEPQDKDIIWYTNRNYSEIVVKPQESEDKE